MIELVENYCRTILTTSKCKTLAFHNLEHTLEVVRNTILIAQQLNFTAAETEPITIAAWFHDVGFCETYRGHEDVSIRIAQAFLQQHDYPAERMEQVVSCIEATKMPQQPQNQYAAVLSDADIFHISTDAFFYHKLLLRREWEVELNKVSTDLEWHLLNLDFLQQHDFFTSYGKSVLLAGQRKNEERVKNLISLY